MFLKRLHFLFVKTELKMTWNTHYGFEFNDVSNLLNFLENQSLTFTFMPLWSSLYIQVCFWKVRSEYRTNVCCHLPYEIKKCSRWFTAPSLPSLTSNWHLPRFFYRLHKQIRKCVWERVWVLKTSFLVLHGYIVAILDFRLKQTINYDLHKKQCETASQSASNRECERECEREMKKLPTAFQFIFYQQN